MLINVLHIIGTETHSLSKKKKNQLDVIILLPLVVYHMVCLNF